MGPFTQNPFPNPRSANFTPEGIIAIGDDWSVETLIWAYRSGVFPWPIDGAPLCWFCPDPRAILNFSKLHLPKSLLRKKRKNPYQLSQDQAFSEVIEACASTPRPGQIGTWITPQLKMAYLGLHKHGYAHSIEVWEGKTLVGGIYGVDSGGVFSAESMFFHRPYCSKLALLALIEHLQSKGLEWMDIQVMTPHMKSLGAEEISRVEFLDLLEKDLKVGRTLF